MVLRADLISTLAVTLGVGLVVHSTADSYDPAAASEEAMAVSYTEQVAPIFAARCVECHGPESTELGLRLDTYDGVMAGSDYGTVVEAGNPDRSLLVDMIESGDMPEDADKLSADEIELIRTWIAEGAANN